MYDKQIQLPFRPGVGMMIINKKNQVFVGKRINNKLNSYLKKKSWQMPQGGIDLGETPSSAALREMEEEIGTKKATIIAESKIWYSYRIPKTMIPKLWEGKYCGQKQKWFLIKYDGKDEEINIDTEIPEFCDWKWIDMKDLYKNIIPFKLKLYKAVIREFFPLIKNNPLQNISRN